MRTAIQKRKRKSLVLKNVENLSKNIVFGWALAFWAGLSWPVASVTVTVSPSFPSGKKGAPVTVTVTGVAFFPFWRERAPGHGHGDWCRLFPISGKKGPPVTVRCAAFFPFRKEGAPGDGRSYGCIAFFPFLEEKAADIGAPLTVMCVAFIFFVKEGFPGAVAKAWTSTEIALLRSGFIWGSFVRVIRSRAGEVRQF